MVTGGDGDVDANAVLVRSMGGPVVTTPGRPGHLGAISPSPLSSALTATLIALETLLAEGGAPTLLRLPSADVASLLVGTWCPSPASRGEPLGLVSAPEPELLRVVQSLWRQLGAATGGRLWLTTAVDSVTHVWAQRAAALAFFGARGLWSLPRPPGATWAAVPIAPPLVSHDPDTCAICLEDYSDRLPTHDATSRSMPGHWITCAHCVCRACIGRMGGVRCPICRALRVRPTLTFSA